jgi:hypothetical protein
MEQEVALDEKLIIRREERQEAREEQNKGTWRELKKLLYKT